MRFGFYEEHKRFRKTWEPYMLGKAGEREGCRC